MSGPDWPRLLAAQPELMIPGPGALSDEAMRILGSPPLPHYGQLWPQLHAKVVDALGEVLGCREPYVFPGTGSAALDAAVFNLLQPGQRVVVPNTGFFGGRLIELARAHGLQVVEVPVPVGAAADVERVAEAMTGAHALLCVHVETSTGVRHPVAELARVATEAGAVVIVDAIASAGGEELAVERLAVDAVVTAGQKGLDGPPGLGIVALSERGRRRIANRTWDCPSWYFDLRRWEQHRREDPWEPHPVTMPTTALLALHAGLDRILECGLRDWVGHRAMLAAYCRSNLIGFGLRPVPCDPSTAANLVVAVWVSDPDAAAERVREAGIVVARGLGPTAGRAIRIGLLGATATRLMIDKLLAALAGTPP